MITMVSAGLLAPKKADVRVRRNHYYLNYGALGLCSVLSDLGHDVRLVHGLFSDPESFALRESLRWQEAGEGSPVLLSIPSFFAVPWARAFCRMLKANCPGVKILAGGRWVVDGNGAWIRQMIPEIDLVVYGTAEARIGLAPRFEDWSRIPNTDADPTHVSEPPLSRLPTLRYELLDDYRSFHPSIEVSRGCGLGCKFCAERDARVSALRDPQAIGLALRDLAEAYGTDALTTYFEASVFVPKLEWARGLAEVVKSNGYRTLWRTETRVDTLSPALIPMLAESGMRVLDLGLESASPEQLLAMGKTRDPARYLARASALLHACNDNGIWTKINCLIYPGETETTFTATLSWLEAHADCIKGISASPMVVYGIDSETRRYIASLTELGAHPVDLESLERRGYVQMHPSHSVDHSRAESMCLEVSRRFMSARDYFDLKAFSYFRRGYQEGDFLADLAQESQEALPFWLPEAELPRQCTNAMPVDVFG